MLFSALRRRRSARNLTITMALIAGGTCRELVVKFIDGTQQTAIFSIK